MTPSIVQSRIAGGPAVGIYRSCYLYADEGGHAFEAGVKTNEIRSGAHGPLSERVIDDEPRFKGKPVGEWKHFSVLFPHLSRGQGELLFDGNDTPLDVLSITDDVVTRFHNAAILKQPDITFGVKQTMLGDVEFALARRTGAARDAANAFVTTYDLRAATIVLHFGEGHQTAEIPYNATADTWQGALRTLCNASNLTVTGSYKKGFTINWGAVGAVATPLTATFNGFPPGTTLTTAVTQAGSASAIEIRTMKFTPWTEAYLSIDQDVIYTQPYLLSWLSGGTWKPKFGAATASSAIACNCTAAALQASLRAVTGDDTLTVTEDIHGEFVVTMAPGEQTASFGAAEITGAPPGTFLQVVVTTAGTPTVGQVARLKLAPWGAFSATEPVKLTWDHKWEPRYSEALGTHNYRFNGLKAKIELTPDEMSQDEMIAALKLQDSGAALGRSLAAGAHDLDIISAGVWVRVYGVGLSDGGLLWAPNKDRIAKLTFVSNRVSLLNDVAAIGTAEPA